MGGAVSCGRDNDDLVDNLIEAQYIVSEKTELAFRAVDRGNYILPQFRDIAYKDSAWRQGPLHLSAPCIYTKAVEALDLRPGLTFLNLGSGTGYLSTVVGLLLGSGGLNHGVELHADAVAYAYKKLPEFKENSEYFDEFDFCDPVMITGNCLQMDSGYRQYDRVYCGAACPEEYVGYVKGLIKVGGIAVLPVDDQLLRVKRTGEFSWESKSILSVSFATLVIPADDDTHTVSLPEPAVRSLLELCRSSVRAVLRCRLQQTMPQPDFRRPRRQDGGSSGESSPSPSRRGRQRQEDGSIGVVYLRRSSTSSSSSSSSDSEAGENDEEYGGEAEQERFHPQPPLPEAEATGEDTRVQQPPSLQCPPQVAPAACDMHQVQPSNMEVCCAAESKEAGISRCRPVGATQSSESTATIGLSKRKADATDSGAGSGASSSSSSSSGSLGEGSKRRHTCAHCRRSDGSATLLNCCYDLNDAADDEMDMGSLAGGNSAERSEEGDVSVLQSPKNDDSAAQAVGTKTKSSVSGKCQVVGEPMGPAVQVHEPTLVIEPPKLSSGIERQAVTANCRSATTSGSTDQAVGVDGERAALDPNCGRTGTEEEEPEVSVPQGQPVHRPRRVIQPQVVLPQDEPVRGLHQVIRLSLGGHRTAPHAEVVHICQAPAAVEPARGGMNAQGAAAADRDYDGRMYVGVAQEHGRDEHERARRAEDDMARLRSALFQSFNGGNGARPQQDEDEESEFQQRRLMQRQYHNAYMRAMASDIECLPLPDVVKDYLSYGRRRKLARSANV